MMGNNGVNITYKVQPELKGIAMLFIYGREFIGNDQVCLYLGRQSLYGNSIFCARRFFPTLWHNSAILHDPERCGVVEFGADKRVLSIEENRRSRSRTMPCRGCTCIHQMCAILLRT